MLYLVLIFSILTAAHIVLDWLLIEKYGVQIDHPTEALIAIMLYVVVVIVSVCADIVTLKEAGVSVIVWPFIRWVIHDLGLNALRGKPFSYIGKGPNSATTDKILAFLVSKGVPIWFTKIVALCASVLAAYCLLNSSFLN